MCCEAKEKEEKQLQNSIPQFHCVNFDLTAFTTNTSSSFYVKESKIRVSSIAGKSPTFEHVITKVGRLS